MLAAFQLPATATREPNPTPFASPSLVAYPPLGTPEAARPLPDAAIIGLHIVQPGENIFCIGRAYGVMPSAIAQANSLAQSLLISAGQVLRIPSVKWADIAPGPVCSPQFTSAFRGLPVATGTIPASPVPGSQLLAVSLDYHCVANCGSKLGSYVVRLHVLVSGGMEPFGYIPAQTYDVSVPHCTTGQGLETVLSADGQTARAEWTYLDSACP